MAVNKNIILKKYNWTCFSGVHVTGFIWVENQLFEADDFAKFIAKKTSSKEEFIDAVKQLDGQFSVVVDKDNEIWVMSGHTWSFPVFYCLNENDVIISDNPENLSRLNKSQEIDKLVKNYFLLFGTTPGNNTLLSNIFQIKPAEMLVLKNGHAQSFALLDSVEPNQLVSSTEEKLQQSLLHSFEKYFSFLKDKQVLLPLTRGYDSRLLACLLKIFGHQNVVCATWGRAGNEELETAQKVAKILGYKHIFVEYNEALISEFNRETEFFEYINFAGHFSSMPFLQDYFALNYLIKTKIISRDTVVLSGHSGDYFAGSHLNNMTEHADQKELLAKITDKYGSSFPLSSGMKMEVEKIISDEFFSNRKLASWQKFESWDFQERQCKFISNSNQLYAHLGMKVLMPLFDIEFIRFFSQIPFSQKVNANFYNSTLEQKFFAPLLVSFDLKQVPAKTGSFKNLKKLIVKLSPRLIKKMYYPTYDPIFYREITSELMRNHRKKEFRHPLKPHFYNAYLIQWYYNYVESKL